MGYPKKFTLGLQAGPYADDTIYHDLIADSDNEDIEGSMRAAVKEFLRSPESEKALELTNGQFNWGDAIVHVPEEIWNKHGIQIIPEKEADYIVIFSHDEKLNKEE